MSADTYDTDGLTPLMRAAIDGDLATVRQLLADGANPHLVDATWGTTTAIGFAARRAPASEIHRQIAAELEAADYRPLSLVEKRAREYWNPEEIVETDVRGAAPLTDTKPHNKEPAPIPASYFYIGSVVAVIAGLAAIANEKWVGASILLTLSPCLLLYPAVRWALGGKDSGLAAVSTFVLEEILKRKLIKRHDGSNRRRRS
ncbi:MAG: ankyrin repeat domain-containing protein [Gammaproteobacteria bacterium]